ncbi:MAG: S8 family serine peptidase, partial [Isosphaeraceae bacterium]|nr:S8 family serine peptidase [Isosphaeraceae bacterium]
MNGTRKARRPQRNEGCPSLECLETRTLLTRHRLLAAQVAIPADPGRAIPAQTYLQGSPTSAFDTLIGATQTRVDYQVDGTGLTAAVIDAGVNYRHEALGGSIGPNSKVKGGYDFADQRADPIATSMQHGTAVAGLIASQDPNHLGVAPGAGIVALRVFDDSNRSPRGFEPIAEALQWVIDHHQQYNITVVNLSITDGKNYELDFYSHDHGIGQRIASLVQQLEALNIPVVTAAGNSFDSATKEQGMGFIAILPDTISVTATDGSDRLLPNAQRLGQQEGGDSATDLAAPGSGLIAPVQGNQFTTVDGTSFSAPIVTGAVLLLQQIYWSRFHQLPSVADLDHWLKAGADPITDPTTGVTLGRLDIPKAAAQIPPAPDSSSGPSSPIRETELIIDGKPRGKVRSDSPENPLSDFPALPGGRGAFSTVEVWSAVPAGSD